MNSEFSLMTTVESRDVLKCVSKYGAELHVSELKMYFSFFNMQSNMSKKFTVGFFFFF